MAKTDPVRVVEDVGAAEALDQGGVVGELELLYIDLEVLRPRTLRMVGEGPHAPAVIEELAGDEPARVAEGAGDDVEPRLHRGQNGKRVRS